MKIRNKLLFGITMVVTLTIAWLGYISLSYIDRIVFDQTRSLMRLASKQSATEIDKWFAARHLLLTAIATDFETEQYKPTNHNFLTKFHSPKLQLQVEHFGKMAATSGCIKVVEKCIE